MTQQEFAKKLARAMLIKEGSGSPEILNAHMYA